MSTENKNNSAALHVIDAEEFAVAEKQAETAGNTYTHEFEKPFTYEGKTYESISFDWDSLTGQDALRIESEMQALNKPVIVPEFSGEYLIRMAARACTERVGMDVLLAMPISAYNRIRGRARSFLLKSGL